MRTEDLIEQLAADLQPRRAGVFGRQLAIGCGAGLLAAGLGLALWLPVRPDLAAAALTPGFWLKLAVFGPLAAAGVLLARRLARPEGRLGGLAWLAAVPLAGLGLAAALELNRLPASAWATAWLGHSASLCPYRILMLALPTLAGLLLVLRRRFAPTRPALAGLAAGLAAGSLGATVYAFHCTETSAMFVATWYVLGVGLSAVLGAAAGPRILRW